MKDQLQAAMKEVRELNKEGIVVKGNKKYTTIAVRVEVFRKYFPDYSVNTRVKVDDGKRVILVAEVYPPGSDRPISTGIAEEIRGSSNVNKTSAIENGETSAIGRALANLGLAGGEYASDFEIDLAQLKDAKIELNTAEKKAAEEKPKDPPKEDPEEADITETLRDDSDFIRDSEAAQSKSEKELRDWANRFLYKEFDKAKSLAQLAAIFRQYQSGYKNIKNRYPSLAKEISKFYEVKEEQLTK
jgi:hypothetical protein